MSFSNTLKEKAGKVWEDCYEHPFLQELGKGTLEKEKFKFYLLQDYRYLIEYAKVFAAGSIKCDEEKYMTKFSGVQHNILYDEMDIHRKYMADFKYEIVEELGVLSENTKGWRKELNLISWNGAAPKYDIRDWSPEHEKMGKGVTLSEEEYESLKKLM